MHRLYVLVGSKFKVQGLKFKVQSSKLRGGGGIDAGQIRAEVNNPLPRWFSFITLAP
jgi:hypothetical protein